MLNCMFGIDNLTFLFNHYLGAIFHHDFTGLDTTNLNRLKNILFAVFCIVPNNK